MTTLHEPLCSGAELTRPLGLQDINFTAMSNHVHEYTNQAMRAFAHCLEIRSKKARVSKVTSGMKAILTAMHMCKRVSVYGVGDTSLSDNSVPYQVRLTLIACPVLPMQDMAPVNAMR